MSTGNITIRTDPPGAIIYVDSLLATDAAGNPLITPTTLTIPEGMHRFLLVLSGYYDDWEHVYIYCDSDIQLDRTLMAIPMPIGQMPRSGFM
jgi:hypothetical protein